MVDQRGFDNPPSSASTAWLGAHEAAARLNVQRRTLYAYVARGLLRSVPGPGGRARRYDRDDIERLAARHRARAGHGPVAASALRWGEPVLETSITSIDVVRGPLYRGQSAVALAEAGTSFERVAELLFAGALPDAAPPWPRSRAPFAAILRLSPSEPAAPAVALGVLVAALAARAPHHAHDDGAVRDTARSLLPLLAAFAGAGDATQVERAMTAPRLSAVLGRSLGGRGSAEIASAIDRALVLMADHELNASTFAARVAASTGADLFACIAAALATLSGPRHGAMPARVEALLDEVRTPRRAGAALRARLARGEELSGFGQPLYPAGDPRAVSLLALARSLSPRAPRVKLALAVAAAGPVVAGTHATCDLGLVALGAALGLPRRAAPAMFAVGRSAGWVAHVLEQRAAGFLIRPRARSA